MKEELEKLVAAGKISRQHVEPLLQLVQSGFAMHRSWGFGKVKSVDTVFARLTIDFPNRPGHSMDLGFAAESLKPIPSDHILARKASDIQSLRQMAALHHLDLIKLVLQSFGAKPRWNRSSRCSCPTSSRTIGRSGGRWPNTS